MASRSDIEAGRAHVLLYMKDQLTKGLSSVLGRVRNWGSAMQTFGSIVAAAGAAALAAVGGMVKGFTDAGSALNDMSARTGIAASTLAELGFAADMTGASIEDVETAIKKSQKAGKDFFQVAEEIAAIEDPAKRTAAAMEAWGKSGTKLLPMIANLKELRAEAQAKGLIPTDESVRMADELGDKFDSIWKVIQAGAFQVAAAVAPLLFPIAGALEEIVVTAVQWVRENGELIRTVVMITAGVTGAGAAIAAIGTGITFLLTPLGGVIAAVAGIGAAVALWMKYTESGKATFSAIADVFAELQGLASSIGDALIAGDLALAGEIIVKELQIAFQRGLVALSRMVGGVMGGVIGHLGTKLIRGDLQGAWDDALKAMGAVWDTLVSGMLNAFKSGIGQIRTLLNSVTQAIQRAANTMATVIDVASNSGMLGTFGNMTKGVAKGASNSLRGLAAGMGILGSTGGKGLGALETAAGMLEKHFADKAGREISDVVSEMGDGGKEAAEGLRRLQEEILELRARAKDGGDAAMGRFGEPGGTGGASGKTFATYSAAALLASIGPRGGGPEERTARAAEATVKELSGLGRRIEKLESALRLA